jgi:IS30 family transposase
MELTELDRDILVAIRETRTDWHACTTREVARRLGRAHTTIVSRVGKMRGVYLDWNEVPGSLHLTRKRW